MDDHQGEQSYNALRDSVHNGLLRRTHLKPYLDAIGLTLDPVKGLAYNFGGVDGLLARQPIAGADAANEGLWRRVA